MLTKALSLLLVTLIGLTLGLEAARFVHAHTTGVAVTGAATVVNIHRALLGFSLLATSGALLLSLRGAVVGAWLSRQWSRFTARLELTLDGLFDFDALNVGDGSSSISVSNSTVRGDVVAGHIQVMKAWHSGNGKLVPSPDDGLLPCRGCSWCGVDPGDLPDELWTECDGSGLYLPSNEAERKRQLAHPKLPVSVLPQPGTPEYEACAQDALDDAAKTTCTGCGDRGHWSPDCPDARPPPRS